jgi:hypothetical protein
MELVTSACPCVIMYAYLYLLVMYMRLLSHHIKEADRGSAMAAG